MKANPERCHLLTSATVSIAIKIKDNEILNRESEKLLGAREITNLISIIIYEICFKKHIKKFMF